MERNQKTEGWVVGKLERTPKYHGFLLFTREHGVLPIKMRSPKKLASLQVPTLLQKIGVDSYLAGGVQHIVSNYVPLNIVHWNTLSLDRLSTAYVFMEMVTSFLPKQLPNEFLYQHFEELVDTLQHGTDSDKLRIIGLYKALFLLGLFSCGDSCPLCHAPFTYTSSFGFIEETLELCCSVCVPPRSIAVHPLVVKWLKLIEQKELSFVMKIVGEELHLKQMEKIVQAVIVQTLGRPLISMSTL